MLFGRKLRAGASGYNFTEELRQILARARVEANRLRHQYVAPEHILLALVADPDGVAAAVLNEIRVQPEDIRDRVEELVKKGSARVSGDPSLPYTSRAKKLLELAMTAARNLGDGYVGAEHLLLGLIDEEKNIAAQVLADLGATRQRTQAAVLRIRGEVDAAPPTFRFEIDDRSRERSIYEQIVAQAQEAVATGKLQSGARLLTVRQLADELDIAPGTVARAYSELERLGVVVTEGKRGTRVAERAQPGIAEGNRPESLVGLLRPVAVAAFHLGATAKQLRDALEVAMRDIFNESRA